MLGALPTYRAGRAEMLHMTLKQPAGERETSGHARPLAKRDHTQFAPIEQQAGMPLWLPEFAAQVADDLLYPMRIEHILPWSGENPREIRRTVETVRCLKESAEQQRFPSP